MADVPVALSPIEPAAPTKVCDGWLVSAVRAHGALRLADRTPLTKVLVRADPNGRVAAGLDVRFGRARRDDDGVLTVGSGIDEWLLLAPPQNLGVATRRIEGAVDDFVSVIDVTHGRALMRLSGTDARAVLEKLCAIDLSDSASANCSAFRSSVAKVATDVIRDDVDISGTRETTYLLHCERSSGQYLFDALLDAGREFGIEVDGFFLDDAPVDE